MAYFSADECPIIGGVQVPIAYSKVILNLVFEVGKPGIHAERFFCLLCWQIVSGVFNSFSFLSAWALASNNVFIIKLVKMWLGGTPDMVVGTLKISSDLLLSFFFFFCFVLQRRSAAMVCSRE